MYIQLYSIINDCIKNNKLISNTSEIKAFLTIHANQSLTFNHHIIAKFEQTVYNQYLWHNGYDFSESEKSNHR